MGRFRGIGTADGERNGYKHQNINTSIKCSVCKNAANEVETNDFNLWWSVNESFA